MRIMIVGGGIGGLTAALALHQAGFDAHVYEQASVLREVGAGVALGPNAVKILHRLGLADILRAVGVRSRWTRATGRAATSSHGYRLPTPRWLAGVRPFTTCTARISTMRSVPPWETSTSLSVPVVLVSRSTVQRSQSVLPTDGTRAAI